VINSQIPQNYEIMFVLYSLCHPTETIEYVLSFLLTYCSAKFTSSAAKYASSHGLLNFKNIKLSLIFAAIYQVYKARTMSANIYKHFFSEVIMINT